MPSAAKICLCLIYARYSSGRQNPRSVDDQLADCRVYAQRCGWQVVGEHADRATSGTRGRSERAGWDALLRRLEAREVPRGTIILTWDLDRWSRDWSDGMVEALLLHKLGHVIADTRHGIYDQTSFGGKIGLAVGVASAADFSEKLSARMRMHKAHARELGLWSGPAPFGYRTAGPRGARYLEADHAEASALRQIFRWAAAGVTLPEISARLTAAGIRPRAGDGWRICTLRQMLVNPTYRGLVVHYGPRFVDGRRRERFYVPEHDRQVARGKHRPLVTDATWRAVAARFRYGVRPRAAAPRRYPLSGLVYCASCGRRCTLVGGENWRAYRCRPYGMDTGCPSARTVSVRALEHAVAGWVRELAEDGEAILAAAEDLATRLAEDAAEDVDVEAAAEAKIADLEARELRLVAAVESGRRPAPILARLDRIAEELAALRAARAASASHDAPSASQIAGALRRASRADPDLWALRGVIKRIDVPAGGDLVKLLVAGERVRLRVYRARRR